MDKLKKSFSLRKKKNIKTPEDDPNNKPISWQEDEKKVREGCCSFQVKYLGFIEVFDSRGMQVCEEAIKALRRPKKKAARAILYVSGDTIRVSDEISKGLIVDQTIEKVSFCSPDRNHKRGFAYICRDGTTRRWMCHAFLAMKETGERLSHAVGCAFAICLEKKQKRESDATQPIPMDIRSPHKGSSFRQTSLTERLQDPQSAILADLPPSMSPQMSTTMINASSPDYTRAAVIPRPHASASFFSERQTSLRMFPKLQESSPFKRELSLRLGELPGSSPLTRKTDIVISEDGREFEDNDIRDADDRQSAFATFTKGLYTSDNSACDSPAHRMSASFQSDSPSILHNNPFLLSGTVNYGASSTFTSQEGINNGTKPNGVQHKSGQNMPDSFHKLQVKENSSLLQSISTSTNGSPTVTKVGNLPNVWHDSSPFSSTTGQHETCSTNPWNEPLHTSVQPDLSHYSLIAKTSVFNEPSKSPRDLSPMTMKGLVDPFDISWIKNNGGVETGDYSSLNNNPFRT